MFLIFESEVIKTATGQGGENRKLHYMRIGMSSLKGRLWKDIIKKSPGTGGFLESSVKTSRKN